MGYQANDIQFSDDALGLGRALRITAQAGFKATFSQDSDNADITIVTYSPGESDPVSRITLTSSQTIDALGFLKAPLYFVDASLGPIIITMPSTIANDNKYRFIRIDDSANAVEFRGILGTERFGGIGAATTIDMYQGDDFDFVTDYLDWFL